MIKILDAINTYHGGPFAVVELGNRGIVQLNLNVDDTGNS